MKTYWTEQIKRMRAERMRNLKPRTIIVNIEHPEWGSWGVYENRDGYYVIHGHAGSRVLDKEEAVKFWWLA